MLNSLYDKLETESVSVVIISVAIMLISGFLLTRLTKLLRLPNVTGYIIAGILIGPYCLNFIPKNVSTGMDFISDIALAFIAFSVGEYFKLSTLKGNAGKVIIITLFEALVATIFVFVLTYYILHLGLAFSIILSALASATAPASTMMTIKQTGAHGDFVNTLLSVVALDDVVSLVAFSVSVSVAIASLGGAFSTGDILIPIAYNILLVLIGAGLGFLLKILMQKRSTDNRLIVSIAFLFAICGIGAALDVSPLLGCMALGTVYINVSNDEKLFQQLNYFSPPILLLFFVKSGLNFRLDALFSAEGGVAGVPLLLIGVLYFFVRILGKYVGAFSGSLLTKKSKEVRTWLGFALVPQAGVAIGLAALGARIIGGETGEMLQTIILSSSILYELIGPALAKFALFKSKSYGDGAIDVEPTPIEKVDEVQELKEKLSEIQKEIAKQEYARSEEEKSFMEGIQKREEAISEGVRRNTKFINRR